MKRLLFISMLAALLMGCTARYQVHNLAGNGGAHLNPSKDVFVVIPEDGRYGDMTYASSGESVAQSVAIAFSDHVNDVRMSETQLDKNAAMSAAQEANAAYLVIPSITHWEQRATEWSGRPSRMAIRVSIYDVNTGKQLDSTAIEGRSRIFSFTSTSPESLLRDPLRRYVQRLYL